MNKAALKRFATAARIELLERVELQARKYGITQEAIDEKTVANSDDFFINGKPLRPSEKVQRNKLISHIKEISFDRVMDEVAYTWFNRFTALRFMEVNDYLPTKVRVLSSNHEDSNEPEMIKEALSLDLDLDKEYVYDLRLNNKTEELFKYLLIKHCNDLNRYMPFMFEMIDDYTEILFPDGLLAPDSFVREMTDIKAIPESNWKEIEVIGWLYQYYIADEKDEVFANLKKRIKISKEKIPAATQLFTPNWIVRYMVENSLGRIWLENHPESKLKTDWTYYMDEAEQDENVLNQLEEIQYKNVNIEEITFLDPACGSGHILTYAFDVFYDMYIEKGYIESEIPKLILEKNLFGLDVDDRAAQLASFAVMMKAREKSRRVFRQEIQLNISAIQESNWLTDEMISKIAGTDNEISEIINAIGETFIDAKEYGSLLKVPEKNYDQLERVLQSYMKDQSDLVELIDKQIIEERLPQLIIQAEMIGKKYDVVCTNPPYMGRSGMNPKLTKYLDKHHEDAKFDLFAAFIERGFDLAKEKGFNSMVTMQSWMFLSSYEKLRKRIITEKTISTLLHMDNMVMGIAFGTVATIARNTQIEDYKGNYTEIKYENIGEDNTPKKFPVKENRYGKVSTNSFTIIPGSPIAYWISPKLNESFQNPLLFEYSISDGQNVTGNNDKYVRFHWEIDEDKLGVNKKWVQYAKGGGYRKWSGNIDSIIDWSSEARDFYRKNSSSRIIPEYLRFTKGITWGLITSNLPSFRVLPESATFDKGGSSIFIKDDQYYYYVIGLLNSKVFVLISKLLNPTLNFQVRDVRSMPIVEPKLEYKQKIDLIVNENILISEKDWDSYETSANFIKNPLLLNEIKSSLIEDAYYYWENHTVKKFNQLMGNEEMLNRKFLEIYGLENELKPEVEDRDVTISKANLERDIQSFISYAIGCSFGRYSLDEEGLIFAGGEFDPTRYNAFHADEDNILPILPGAYFEDDIVSRFVGFVRVTFGEESLEENLDFVADAIKRRKNETARETLRHYFMNDFYKDHVRTYKKRPIYWQFTSGREKAFNCLIYMHRYDKTTLSRIRTDYLHEYQIRLDVERQDLVNIIDGDYTTREINVAKRELSSLDRKIDELKKYDEVLHNMADMQIEIELDDGVKVNYEKFDGLVVKI